MKKKINSSSVDQETEAEAVQIAYSSYRASKWGS